jgi:hypothetical protein
MKKLLLTAVILMTNMAYSQWVTKKVDNGLDDPYRIAYCVNDTERALLKLERGTDYLAFYVTGSYYCDDYPTVDIGLISKAGTKRYQFKCKKSNDNKTVFIILNILSEEEEEFLQDFRAANELVMRVNETNCTDELYRFKMTGSSDAIDYMRNGL